MGSEAEAEEEEGVDNASSTFDRSSFIHCGFIPHCVMLAVLTYVHCLKCLTDVWPRTLGDKINRYSTVCNFKHILSPRELCHVMFAGGDSKLLNPVFTKTSPPGQQQKRRRRR